MAASDLTSVAFITKRVYSDKRQGDLAMRDHPFMRMINKEGGFNGVAHFYTVKYGNPAAIGGTFGTAQSAAASSKGVQFQVSRKVKYGFITLNGEAIAATEGNQGAFYDLVTLETDGVLEEMGDRLAFDLYRDGTGLRGRRASASTNVITLTNQDDARNFKVGMTVIAATAASGTSGVRTGNTTVAGVDEDTGTVTLTSAAGITSFADNDYLFAIGDPGTCMEGLEVCNPLTAPTGGDSFRGVDRSVDTRRLAGVRLDNTASSIEENAGLVAVRIAQVGKKADQVFLNPIRFWEVARRMGAKVEYDGGGGNADYGFESISIHSPAGTLKAYSDPDCPINRGRVVASKAHYVKHLKGFPHIIMDDGNKSLRATSADDIEMRIRAFSNYIQIDPGAFGVFSI
jgi:hypothetical protein